jgi:hypothetical protein
MSDTEKPGSKRYWDGTAWTEHRDAAPTMTRETVMAQPFNPPAPQAMMPMPVGGVLAVPDRKILPLFLVCFFLGSLGIHRFMVGKIGTGILMLVTFGGLGIWTLVDLIMLATGNFKDKAGRKIVDWS